MSVIYIISIYKSDAISYRPIWPSFRSSISTISNRAWTMCREVPLNNIIYLSDGFGHDKTCVHVVYQWGRTPVKKKIKKYNPSAPETVYCTIYMHLYYIGI